MPLPVTVSFQIKNLFGDSEQTIALTDGLTTLVGPNGSGKTQVLGAIRNQLQQLVHPKIVRYLSPGRLAALEQWRSDINGMERGRLSRPDGVPIGHSQLRATRQFSSGIVGDILTLDQRADIRVKVEARLLALFQRRITLEWMPGGLQIDFARTDSDESYPAGQEASGLLHLISILTAAFDDEVGALLLDEPEVSLHPQLQAYVLRELRKVSGDPISAGRKLVVISTHSPAMLQVRQPKDLPRLIFFQNSKTAPQQVSSTAPELQSKALAGLLARMGDSHRIAFFAQRLLLVEGPSDEIIANALINKLDLPIHAAGTQIVPVIGKGEMGAVRKLFRLAGKECTVLTDLDGFVDDGNVIGEFSDNPEIVVELSRIGHRDLRSFANSVREDLKKAVANHYADLASVAESNPYWTNRDSKIPIEVARARAGTAALLTMDEVAVIALPQSQVWTPLRARLLALLDILELGGCFVLRRGALESYVLPGSSLSGLRGKPESAAAEAELIIDLADTAMLRQHFGDIIRALEYSASAKVVDEAGQLRQLLLAGLAPCLDGCTSITSDLELNQRARSFLKDRASLISIENLTVDGGEPRLRVALTSRILESQRFPIEITKANLYSLLHEALPSPE